jgi:FtsH-binding integral membrane protein
MNYPNQNPGGAPYASSSMPLPVSELSVDARMDFIRKTYSLFLAGILCALVVGIATARIPALTMASFALSNNIILAVILLFGLSIGAQAVSRIEGLNYAALFGFTGFIGFWITAILISYEARIPGIVTQAGVLSMIIFGALTAFAFISKTDFSFLRGILFVGIIAVVLGGLANIFFFKSPAASYWMAWVTLMVFSGFVLYDTSNIMRTHDSRGYVSAALGLFLNFLNIFLALLRILGGNRD